MTDHASVPEYVRAVRREADSVHLVPVRLQRVPQPNHGPVLVSVVRDEIDRLPALLDHYRGLGVPHFVFLDNGSVDGTADFLARQPDVDVYLVDRPFDWVRKQGWIHRVVREYGWRRWYVCVDADEYIVYAGCETHTLSDVMAAMERLGVRRVRGMLVDMYAPGPVLAYRQDPERPLGKCFNLFDGAGYDEHRVPRMISRRGGPRRRCFSPEGLEIDPELTKYPLFRLEPGEVMVNPHHIFPYAANFDSACFLGILHYKFLPGLMARIRSAIESESYWEGSREYKAYLAVLTANPDLALEYDGSVNFGGPESLLEAGLIEPIGWS